MPSIAKPSSQNLSRYRGRAAPTLALGVALALHAPVLAAQSKSPASANRDTGGLSAPSGPMDVRADRAEYVRDGTSKLTGNVTLRSDTFSMDASAMTLKQQGDGEFQGRLTGSPAHLTHRPEQPGDPLMTAQASVMTYDTRTQIVELQGNARVTRGTDIITGNVIRYSVADRRVQAVGSASKSVGGSGNGQVRIILTPKKNGAGGKSAARPDAPADEPLTLGTDKVFDTPPGAAPAPAATP